MTPTPTFDVEASKKRCRQFRKRILDISQTVSALHIGSAYSCMEIVETIYFGLMRKDTNGKEMDTFLMSKGHGCMAQYVSLEAKGVLSKKDLDLYCKPGGRLGTHPDYGVPGIEASTGSLGHGLCMAMGMAVSDQVQKKNSQIYVVMSDGELQEGSVWEAMMLAPTLKLNNLIAFVDLNDLQSLGRTSEYLPNFYPLMDKITAFGWEAIEVSGHDSKAIYNAVVSRSRTKPTMIIAKTTKGKGVSYMESAPIWHYRSPSLEEYKIAMAELDKEIQ
jgi:transketolase